MPFCFLDMHRLGTVLILRKKILSVFNFRRGRLTRPTGVSALVQLWVPCPTAKPMDLFLVLCGYKCWDGILVSTVCLRTGIARVILNLFVLPHHAFFASSLYCDHARYFSKMS